MYKILTVDDEEMIRKLIRKYAEFEGHEVTEAADGMQAVKLCREQDFDIIIVSGGKLGTQLELAPADLAKACSGEFADIIM